MKLSLCAALASAALSAPAFAVDYAQERGVAPSTVPLSTDETGKVSNAPTWSMAPGRASVSDFFVRYDANRDGVVSWAEAQADADLVQVFARADANGDGVLTPAEFQSAAVLAGNISPRPRG